MVDANYFGFTDKYWNNLSQAERDLLLVVRPLPRGQTLTVGFNYLEDWLARQEKDALSQGGIFELCPDFQRGHVWTQNQKVRYLENLFRRVAPREIRFNCPNWLGDNQGDIHPAHMVCIDGLQRLTAVREFIAGKYSIFGGRYVQDLNGTSLDIRRASHGFEVIVNSITKRSDLLQFYIDINNGGTAHTEQEIERVRAMMGTPD
jgi:hypothetical protein